VAEDKQADAFQLLEISDGAATFCLIDQASRMTGLGGGFNRSMQHGLAGFARAPKKRHSNRLWRSGGKPEASVEILSESIRNEARVPACWHVGFNVAHDFTHDDLAEALSLVRGNDRNVYNLVEATPVAHNPSHADNLTIEDDLNGEEAASQTSTRCFFGL
jgi:hypothetical protein